MSQLKVCSPRKRTLCIYVNNCHFTAQSFVILGKVEYTKFRMGLQAAKCVLTNSYEMEYFQKSMMNQIYEASFLLFVFVDPSLIFRNPNPSLFSVSSDHHCNEAYDWWPIADLWSIKCVLSAPRAAIIRATDIWHCRACSTHYSSTLQPPGHCSGKWSHSSCQDTLRTDNLGCC